MTTPDASAGLSGYTVKFGTVARTIDYTDDVATITFTFDVEPGQSPPWTLILEHDYQAPRTATYLLAFNRTKQFLESRGYKVQVDGA